MTKLNPYFHVKNALNSIELDGDRIPIWRSISYSGRQTAYNAFMVLFTIVTLFVVLGPIYWMIKTAFTRHADLFTSVVNIIPPVISLSGFEAVIQGSLFPVWYMNTILVSLGVVITTVTAATLAGYGLTRIEIPFKKTFARGILFGYMFPPILLAIPMFIFWRELGLINSKIGLILAETGLALPFSIWLMWQYFQTVPFSLEESAQMAGASRFRAFYDIALPMAKPGMVAVGVFSFAVGWNQFTMPQVLMVQDTDWVIVQGLFSFTRQATVLWEQLMAASFLTIIPAFIFVFFLQKYLLRGFRAGGVG
jgi:multiple sugar transport system permease protein